MHETKYHYLRSNTGGVKLLIVNNLISGRGLLMTGMTKFTQVEVQERIVLKVGAFKGWGCGFELTGVELKC